MKCTKRFAALVLAMMMAFSVMAVTAAAYDSADAHEVCCENEIEPRIRASRCVRCGGNAYERTGYIGTELKTWLECEDCGWRDYN